MLFKVFIGEQVVLAELIHSAMPVAPPRVCVCVDGWFILGAMIALMHHRRAAPPSQSPISVTQTR